MSFGCMNTIMIFRENLVFFQSFILRSFKCTKSTRRKYTAGLLLLAFLCTACWWGSEQCSVETFLSLCNMRLAYETGAGEDV